MKPDLFEAYNTLGNILRNQGELDQAIENYRLALALKPEAVSIYSNLVFTLLFASGYSPSAILAENRRWAEFYETPLLPEAFSHSYEPTGKQRLKIGYVTFTY